MSPCPSTSLRPFVVLISRSGNFVSYGLKMSKPKYLSIIIIIPNSSGNEGLKSILNRIDSGNIWILTDSRSSIQHLQNWTRVDDPGIIRITNKLRTITKYGDVHFQLIPSHVNVPGNEVADFLAKRRCSEIVTTDYALT
ncbi:RNase H domain-containing protein [Trichonephila clavipes]|nr:RNase H domain-containing protein [Trichonephila clavipes]